MGGLGFDKAQMVSSTNLIENLFSRVREIGRRVKHWQSGTTIFLPWPSVPSWSDCSSEDKKV